MYLIALLYSDLKLYLIISFNVEEINKKQRPLQYYLMLFYYVG